jgi:hypothetical protein
LSLKRGTGILVLSKLVGSVRMSMPEKISIHIVLHPKDCEVIASGWEQRHALSGFNGSCDGDFAGFPELHDQSVVQSHILTELRTGSDGCVLATVIRTQTEISMRASGVSDAGEVQEVVLSNSDQMRVLDAFWDTGAEISMINRVLKGFLFLRLLVLRQ